MGEVKSFYYQGPLSASKSLMNRALVVQSFFPDLEILGQSNCHDVSLMKRALELWQGPEKLTIFDCGSAGTTFRFLLTRLSREKGEFTLTGDERLFTRPHHPLLKALEQLGVKTFFESKNCLKIVSQGWSFHQPIVLDLSYSSQFISSLLLSAWKLESDLTLLIGEERNSYSYLQMTIDFLKEMGMEIRQESNRLIIPAEQTLKKKIIEIEPDMSSAFALAAFAAFRGELKLLSFPVQSLQPDSLFVDILKEMGAKVSHDQSDKTLLIQSAPLKAIQIDLSNQPDLFPVLAVLLSCAEGDSQLTGLKLLNFKESHRLENIQELLSTLGVVTSCRGDQLIIRGQKNYQSREKIVFNPDQDHRMAMAAALAGYQGANIEILHPEVVNKSFPEFWEILAHA